MAYPPLYTRLSNFVRDAYNGLVSPSPSSTDAELNAVATSLNAVINTVRGITAASGRLQNVAQAIAQALVATWTGAAPAAPGPIVTTIAWDSVYSANSMLVVIGGVALAPSAYTVTHVSGFVEITPSTYPATGATTTVWVFEAGAGILTDLASTANGKGASLIGVEDPDDVLIGATVEAGLVEVATNLAALVTSLGALNRYVLADGTVAMTDDFDAGGFKVTNAADGSADGDLVTVRQIASYIDAWTDLSQFYVKRDGTTAMAGPFNFGNSKGLNLADPDLSQPLDAVNVRTMLNTVATSGSSPVGVIQDYVGDSAPDNWLICDGQAYLGTSWPILYSLVGTAFKSGYAQGTKFAVFSGKIVAANLNSDALANLGALTLDGGQGYVGVPMVRVYNPDGTLAPGQPTFTVTVTAADTSAPPNVTGGVVSISLAAESGSGILEGATIRILPLLESDDTTTALAPLPTGYFRVPDLRGRTTLGVGTESKSPGITNPPDVNAGDAYNATTRLLGAVGGAEKVVLDETSLPTGTVVDPTYQAIGSQAGGTPYTVIKRTIPESTAASAAFSVTPPFVVLSKIIKAA